MTASAPGPGRAPVEGTAADGRPFLHIETLDQWRAWLRELVGDRKAA